MTDIVIPEGAVSRVLRHRIDINEQKEKNLVIATFELPDLKKNVFIDVHNNVLTVSGESKFESDSNENGYRLRDRRFGRFSRSIPVPEGVKPEEIKAPMEKVFWRSPTRAPRLSMPPRRSSCCEGTVLYSL